MLRFAEGVPALVRVFDETEAEAVRAVGGRPMVLAEATARDLIATLERDGLLGLGGAAP